MATTKTVPKTSTTETQPMKRSLWKRLLLRVVMVLLLAALGGAGYLYYRANRLITSQPYQDAVKFVTNSKLVKDKVGEPLQTVGILQNLNNGSSINEEGEFGEAQLQFKMLSPRGQIEVSGGGRKRDNSWSITSLQVLVPGDRERLNLMSEVNKETAGDTPKFDPNKQPEKVETKINLPPPETDIKIEIPGDLPTVPEK